MRNIVSDIFDKSAQVMLDKILENSADTFFVSSLLCLKVEKETPSACDTIDDYIIPE